ncbi:MAG: DUF2726 domain-containing protein [Burkholderiales bacterium]|nr:MAG: DUF2726 domain-containing protein [Burkholderiales bacterium]
MFSKPLWELALLALLGLLASAVAGAVLHAWWLSRQARERRRIPARWPLSPRLVANTEERAVWNWLVRVFPDYHLMLKLPVTRFTLPRNQDSGLHWYELLSSLYCTFTVVDANGHVYGCVDVFGRAGPSRRQQALKQALLNQCGIAYLAVAVDRLPATLELRRAFLGDLAHVDAVRQREDAAIAAARANLRASLRKQRNTRESDRMPLMSTGPTGTHVQSGFGDSQAAASLQPNSFLTPLDSRKGDLN